MPGIIIKGIVMMHSNPKPMENFVKYFDEWGKTHKCILQVSPPRSGGHWLRYIIKYCSGIESYDCNPNGVGIDFPDNAYFNNHWFISNLTGDKYVLLVRDPRAIMWSIVKWGRNAIDKDMMNSLRSWSHFVTTYRGHFIRYLPQNTLVVQYERICLFPVEEIARVMIFIGYKIKKDIQEVVDYLDTGHYDKHPDLPFKTGYDRYLACCLKWMNDEYTVGHRNFIWRSLGDIMIHYGYTKDGHAPMLFNP